ncbi:thioredoxin family protein [Paralimibaculum aggregatum]|uniref:Thioredoxin family protein n=1 Tax=Paralimibaculum aggregatum TaxID=3036245 RepID=A0ABQ6LF89_9RHOB|nr:thioredoxin family protein [Limibaculum sp. NKW23]
MMVELYTSQGCNSCPPADAALGRMAAREDLVALAFHVDYWDYLGWRDTFARPDHTERQFAYRTALRARMVYTPQVIVQGRSHAVGSHEAEVAGLIEAAQAAQAAAMPAELALEPGRAGGGLTARLEPAPGGGNAGPARLWLAVYDRSREVDIGRGENGGKRITYHNIVRELRALLDWDGASAEEVTVPMPPAGQGVAVWLQRAGPGAILCVAKYES